MLRLNEPAPPLRLRNQQGILTGLAELRGHIAVLWWQRSLAQPSAEIIARALRDQYPDLTARNAAVLGISNASPQEILRFHDRLGLPFDLLNGAKDAASTAYGVSNWWRASPDVPLTFVIDPAGLLQASHQVVRRHAAHVETLLTDIVRAAA